MTDLVADAPAVGNTRGQDRFLFVACFVALVATAFAFIIRIMLMETWQIEFGLSETQKGEIQGAGFWPFGISIVLFSLVIDRIGYRRTMVFAFACHVVSALLMVSARGYWWLYFGSILNGLAAGTVEAVINPAVASMFPKKKTRMLTILHGGWPGGMVLGGVAMLALKRWEITWHVNAAIILVPTLVYGLMLLKARFPVSERVVAGVPYREMLKEAGALGCLIVVYMIVMEVNRVLGMKNLVDTGFFDLPSLPMTIVLGVLSLAYLIYTGSLGRWMYVFLLLVMILLAITELGTDAWIKEFMGPAMTKIGWDSGWIIVYTATIMMILRFCIAPIEKLLKPLGVLLVSSLFAAAGLYLLSGAQGGMIWVWATIYGTGQCFFWPVTLGLISERFPKGGALTLNAIAGVGMLGVGILGNPLMGFWQDTRIDEKLKPNTALYAEFMESKPKESIFGSYKALDGRKVKELEYRVALHLHKAKVQEAQKGASAKKLAELLSKDKEYLSLLGKTFDLLKPTKPTTPKPGRDASFADKTLYDRAKTTYDKSKAAHDAADSYETKLAYVAARGAFLSGPQFKDTEGKKKALDDVTTDAKKNAMATIAILPLIMAVCYLLLILYFKAKGGYTAVELSAKGEEIDGHEPSAAEQVADAEQTPSE